MCQGIGTAGICTQIFAEPSLQTKEPPIPDKLSILCPSPPHIQKENQDIHGVGYYIKLVFLA